MLNAYKWLLPLPSTPDREYPDPQYTAPSTTAGPAFTELPAPNCHRMAPVFAFNANIWFWFASFAIDAAYTTPFATLIGARSHTPTVPKPGGVSVCGSATCQRTLPVSGSSAAHEPPVDGMFVTTPSSVRLYGM